MVKAKMQWYSPKTKHKPIISDFNWDEYLNSQRNHKSDDHFFMCC